jgi:hypothetical protein
MVFIGKLLRDLFGAKEAQKQGNGEHEAMESCRFYSIVLLFTRISWVFKSRKLQWAKSVARMREMRNSYNILLRNHECKRQHGRPGCRLEDTSKPYAAML